MGRLSWTTRPPLSRSGSGGCKRPRHRPRSAQRVVGVGKAAPPIANRPPRHFEAAHKADETNGADPVMSMSRGLCPPSHQARSRSQRVRSS